MTEEKKSTDFCEQQFEDCLDNSLGQERHQLWHLSWIGLAAALLVGISLWVSPWVFDSIEDPEALYRWVVIKVPQAAVTVFVLLGSIALADVLFPGKILKKVASDSLACAIVLAALFIAVGLTLM